MAGVSYAPLSSAPLEWINASYSASDSFSTTAFYKSIYLLTYLLTYLLSLKWKSKNFHLLHYLNIHDTFSWRSIVDHFMMTGFDFDTISGDMLTNRHSKMGKWTE